MANNTRSTTPIQDIALLLIRLLFAAIFLYYGSQKLFGAFGGPGIAGFATFLTMMHAPMPYVSATLSACAEFFGGLFFLIGTGQRLFAIPLAFNMLVATFVSAHGAIAHNAAVAKAIAAHAKNPGHPTAVIFAAQFPFSLLVITIAMLLLGPGNITLGRLLSGKKIASPA